MAKPSAPPTVVDVAAAADVAIGTVSRVLNTPDAVRPDIRQRVLDAITRLDYRRLRQRRAPVSTATGRRRGNLGIVLIGMDESLAHLPVITEAIHGVELATAAEGINLMLANVPRADRVPAFLARNQVDGLIVKSPLLGDFKACASAELVAAISRVPHVWLIGRPDNSTGDVCAVDNDTGARLAADYLHAHIRRELGIGPAQGKRYSWGYPAIPDLEDHKKVFQLLPGASQDLGMSLSSACQLIPEQSTAAIIVHHTQAKYYSIGESRVEQLMQ